MCANDLVGIEVDNVPLDNLHHQMTHTQLPCYCMNARNAVHSAVMYDNFRNCLNRSDGYGSVIG